MSFYIYDITFLVVFTLAVAFFLHRRRHNLKREGIMYLYRTQVGIRFINYVGGKYKRTLSVLGFLGVVVGYFLMASMVYFLYQLLYLYLFVPEAVRAIKIPPLMPLIPYLPEAFKIDFLPPFYFTYWIISIAVIALFHEFAHGIIARRYNIKILTTGFGFLGPFLAAFVEPDEKQMESKPKYQQLAVLSAGVFTNFILAIFFFLLLSFFFSFAYIPAGALFNTYTPGAVAIENISMIGGKPLLDRTEGGILNLIATNGLTDDLVLGNNESTITLTNIVDDSGNFYYITIEKLKLQLDLEESEYVFLYEDLPAINAGLRGTIIEIDGQQIVDYDDLARIMEGKKPGEKITLVTKDVESETILNYDITLGTDRTRADKGVIGIGYSQTNEKILGKVVDFFNFFKKPATYYEPRFNGDFVLFLYNLIWWLALINLSVALVNMWPVAIFDGGRFFYLTIWGITGNETFARFMFKATTYVILLALVLLMVGWFRALF